MASTQTLSHIPMMCNQYQTFSNTLRSPFKTLSNKLPGKNSSRGNGSFAGIHEPSFPSKHTPSIIPWSEGEFWYATNKKQRNKSHRYPSVIVIWWLMTSRVSIEIPTEKVTVIPIIAVCITCYIKINQLCFLLTQSLRAFYGVQNSKMVFPVEVP